MKKVLSAVLAGSMLMSMNGFAENVQLKRADESKPVRVEKQEDEPVAVIFTTNPDNEAMYQLQKYGIIEGDPNGDMRPYDFITRAEMTKIICKMLSLKIPEYQASFFEDVSLGDWYFGYVMTAVDNDIVQGESDGKFNPEKNITYSEVIKMIVSAMGYAPSAEATGGFPDGYAMCASRLGITKDVDHALAMECRRNTVFKMLNNALDVPFMLKSGYGDEEEYIIADGSADGIRYVTFRTKITGNHIIPIENHKLD